jgi:WD40 repeat protein
MGTDGGNVHILDFNGNEIKRFAAHSKVVREQDIFPHALRPSTSAYPHCSSNYFHVVSNGLGSLLCCHGDAQVNAVCIDESGEYVVSCSNDGKVRDFIGPFVSTSVPIGQSPIRSTVYS